MSIIVSVKDVTKKIGAKHVLENMNFDVEEGSVVGLLGPNGAGKTTLIKLLMDIYHADCGEINVCGERTSFKARNYIAYMPDINHLFPWMRVYDAIKYYSDMFEDFDAAHANELCAFLDINKNDTIKNLSKGTIQQVLIMLTFSRNAKLYLLDEPIGGIDIIARNKIVKTIFSSANNGSTVIISTHQVTDVETLLSDVLFLNNGKLIYSGSADDIRSQYKSSIEEYYMEVYGNV